MFDNILNSLIYLISFIFMLGIIVLIHEAGHFVVAKHFKVYCPEFSIGMGPVLISKQIGETKYSLRLLPIGGFVAIAGEDDEEINVNVPKERTLNGLKTWKQISVMLAGVFMNFVLAFVVFLLIINIQGKVAVASKNLTISEVVADSPAAIAGLVPGDKIDRVTYANEKYKITNMDDFTKAINFNPKEEAKITIERDGKDKIISLKPKYDKKREGYVVGIAQKPTIKKVNFFESIPYAVDQVVDNTKLVFESLNRLIHGHNLDQLAGPVGIFKLTGKVAKAGLISWLTLLAVLSVNIGIFNLIPIPILDGGRVVIALIERLIGRQLNEKLVNTLMYIGMGALLLLLAFATFNDLTKMF